MTRARVLVDSSHPQWALALRMAGFDAVEAVPDGGSVDIAFIDGATGEVSERLARARSRQSALPVIVCSQDRVLDSYGSDVTVTRPPLTVEVLSALIRSGIPAKVLDTAGKVGPGAEPQRVSILKGTRPPPGAGPQLTTPPRPPSPPRPQKSRRPSVVSELEDTVLEVTSSTPSPRALLEQLVLTLARNTHGDVAVLRQEADGTWSAAAGQGLRSIELRSIRHLPGPVAALCDRVAVLAVGETDDLRTQLAGFPLARHRSLLILRQPLELLTVIGREAPFEKRDIHASMSAVREITPRIREALKVEAVLLALVAWYEG